MYGAALELRQSGKLEQDKNTEMTAELKKNWRKFNSVSQEQMTRLRVSLIFHRSVEEQCNKLEKLKKSVLELNKIEDIENRKTKLRKFLASREKLLLEIGRMVRLGRLLKSRLNEPFIFDNLAENS